MGVRRVAPAQLKASCAEWRFGPAVLPRKLRLSSFISIYVPGVQARTAKQDDQGEDNATPDEAMEE